MHALFFFLPQINLNTICRVNHDFFGFCNILELGEISSLSLKRAQSLLAFLFLASSVNHCVTPATRTLILQMLVCSSSSAKRGAQRQQKRRPSLLRASLSWLRHQGTPSALHSVSCCLCTAQYPTGTCQRASAYSSGVSPPPHLQL